MMANRIAKGAGYLVAALWFFGGAACYFYHFTQAFYSANQGAVDALFSRFAALWGHS